MECNIAKQDVTIERILLSKTPEQSAQMEFSLPDYCPDIERILKCCTKPVINQKLINADSLLIDGIVYVNLLYSDSKKQIRSFEYPYPFSEKTDLTQSATEALTKRVTVKPIIDSLSCKAITDRRVQVKFTIGLNTCVKATFAKPIITDIDMKGCEQLRAFAPSSSPIAVEEKYVSVTDNLSLPEDAPEIRSILRTDVRSTVTETKAIGKKAVVKGEILIDIMYIAPDSKECKCAGFTLPYAQIIDVDALTEQCTISVQSDIASANIRPKTNMNGEIRNIGVEIKVCLMLSAYCDSDVPLIEDAFSTDCDTSLTYDSVDFEKVEKKITDTVIISKLLDIPSDNAQSVVDCFASIIDLRGRCDDGQVSISGSLCVTVITQDSSDELYSFERNADFEYKSGYEVVSEKYTTECSAVVTSVEAKVTSSGVEIKCTVSVLSDVIGTVSKKVVTDITFDENKRHRECCLIAFNAKKGADIWGIAKKYGSSCETIKQINGLDNNILPDDRILILVQ